MRNFWQKEEIYDLPKSVRELSFYSGSVWSSRVGSGKADGGLTGVPVMLTYALTFNC